MIRPRLEMWAKEIGLDMDNPVEFEERFRGNRIVYVVTMDILKQICDIVTRHKDLEKKYGLRGLPDRHLEVLVDDISDIHIENITATTDIWTKRAQDHWEESLMASQKRISQMRKLKWTISDKDKFRGLVDNLKALNNGLREILPVPRQRSLDRSLIITQSSRPEELDLLASVKAISGTYAAAAMFKSQAIRQLKSAIDNTNASSQAAKQLLIDHTAIKATESDLRVMGQLKVKTAVKDVLIEYKTFGGDDPNQRETFKARILRLIQLLHISPKPVEYRVLDCRGYTIRPASLPEQWGLIYSIPAELEEAHEVKFVTLHDLLRDAKTNAPPAGISLGDRFRLAALLANSLSYIHAVGWLHRSVSSWNVLCFATDTTQNSIQHPYLSGFEYARLDSAQEISEVDNGDTAFSSLHRHPDYRQSARRNKYRRSYELYSLGVLLVEIGLWKRIEVFNSASFDPHAFAAHLVRKVVPLLEYFMGTAYLEATVYCLDSARFGLGDEEGQKLSEAFSQKVVQQLDSCRA